MLPRNRRLTSSMIQEMRGDAVSVVHSLFFVARVVPMAEPPSPTRFAVVVSQKIAKSAVGRHRVKRRVHGALEDLLAHIENGWRVALYAKPAIREASPEELGADLKRGLKKAGVLG